MDKIVKGNLSVHFKPTIALDGAFAVAPDDGIARDPAYPHQESQRVLQGQQPALFAKKRVAYHEHGCGRGGAQAKPECEHEHRPSRAMSGPQQEEGQGERVGKDLSPVAEGARAPGAAGPAQAMAQGAQHALAADAMLNNLRGKHYLMAQPGRRPAT